MILKSLLSVVQHGLSLHGHQVEETVDALLLRLRRWAGHAFEELAQARLAACLSMVEQTPRTGWLLARSGCSTTGP